MIGKPYFVYNDKFDFHALSENPCMSDFLDVHFDDFQEYLENLAANPNASKIFKNRMHFIDDTVARIFSANPDSVECMEKRKVKIDVRGLLRNPRAMHLIEKTVNFDTLKDVKYWRSISENPSALHILEKYKEKIVVSGLLKNPSAKHLIEERLSDLDHLGWHTLFEHPQMIHHVLFYLGYIPSYMFVFKEAIPFFEEGVKDQHSWYMICQNPDAIEIIKRTMLKQPKKICFDGLSANPHPEAIEILKKNKNKIALDELSRNPNAKDLILELLIVRYDYRKMKMANAKNASLIAEADWSNKMVI